MPYAMQVSLDGGQTFVDAPQGVVVLYPKVDVPGEDERGQVNFSFTEEGLITDVWVSREEHLDHNIGTSSQMLDDIVGDLVDAND